MSDIESAIEKNNKTINVEDILATFFLRKYKMGESISDDDSDEYRRKKHKKHKSKSSKSKHKKSRSHSSDRKDKKFKSYKDYSSSEEKDIQRLQKLKKKDSSSKLSAPDSPVPLSNSNYKASAEPNISSAPSNSNDIPCGPSLETLLAGVSSTTPTEINNEVKTSSSVSLKNKVDLKNAKDSEKNNIKSNTANELPSDKILLTSIKKEEPEEINPKDSDKNEQKLSFKGSSKQSRSQSRSPSKDKKISKSKSTIKQPQSRSRSSSTDKKSSESKSVNKKFRSQSRSPSKGKEILKNERESRSRSSSKDKESSKSINKASPPHSRSISKDRESIVIKNEKQSRSRSRSSSKDVKSSKSKKSDKKYRSRSRSSSKDRKSSKIITEKEHSKSRTRSNNKSYKRSRSSSKSPPSSRSRRSRSHDKGKRHKKYSGRERSRSSSRRRRSHSKSDSRDRHRSHSRRNRYRSRSRSYDRSSYSKSRHRRDSSSDRDYKSRKARKRSRSNSRESERSKTDKIDQVKIRQLAEKNVLNMIEKGTLPEGLSLENFKKEQVVSLKSGGKSVKELTDFCVKLSKKENDPTDDKSSVSVKEHTGDSAFINHPFKIKEASTIKLNIKNAIQIPIKTHAEKFADTARLSSQFPVSSGNQHRQKELEWVPVDPPAKLETTANISKALVPLTQPASSLPILQAPSVGPVLQPSSAVPVPQQPATASVPEPPSTLPEKQTAEVSPVINSPEASVSVAPSSIPMPAAETAIQPLPPPPLPPMLPPPMPPIPCEPPLPLCEPPLPPPPPFDMAPQPMNVPVDYPIGYTNTFNTPTTYGYPVATEMNNFVFSTQSTTFSDQSTSVFPVRMKSKKPIDVASVVSQRFKALTKLQTCPNDIGALQELEMAQASIQDWVQSQQVPGLFTGSTGAKPLSVEELSGPRHWIYRAKKDIFTRAAPVTEGKGMSLLKKMGWNPGEGLGKNKEGSLEPLVLDIKTDKKGLVSEGEGSKRMVSSVLKDLQGKHPVSALMELCSKRKWKPPLYTLIKDAGPAHKKLFLFKVEVNNVEYQAASPVNNKKIAKADAAVICLQTLSVFPKAE